MPTNHNGGALSTRPAEPGIVPAFPLVIAEWERNSREVVRIAIDQFNGRPTVNARVWYYSGDELKPGQMGITLAVKHLVPLAAALTAALDQARELGLIEGDQ